FISSLGYNFGIPEKKLNASFSLSYNKTDVALRKIVNISPNFTASKTLLDDKLRVSLNQSLQFRSSNGERDGLTSTTSLNLGYTFQRHTLSLNSGYLTNRYKAQYDGINFSNFTETRSNLSYSFSF